MSLLLEHFFVVLFSLDLICDNASLITFKSFAASFCYFFVSPSHCLVAYVLFCPFCPILSSFFVFSRVESADILE